MEDNKKAVPKEVRESDYGCPSCLWHGVECKNGSLYKPSKDDKRRSKCDGYVYCD